MEQNEFYVKFIIGDGIAESRIFATEGESLLDVARRADVAIDAPCSGNGSCGKCRVKLLSGDVKSEAGRHIDAEAYAAGERLACASLVTSNVSVLVPNIAPAHNYRMKITDLRGSREEAVFEAFGRRLSELGFTGDSGIELVSVDMPPPDADDPKADRERLLSALAAAGEDRVDVSLHALRALPKLLRDSGFSVRCVLRRPPAADGESGRSLLMDVFPGGGEEPVLAGLALDIGTTTISALIVNLVTGELLAEGSVGNSQIRYGADVINRIIESTRPGGLERLRTALLYESILRLTQTMCGECGVPHARVYRVSVAANTVMTHLFAGVFADNIRLEPYVPAFFELG
ncbi:MAG: 2Fe-2S iron-sulfur cluster binding domain-containing protein, partial [Clostridiales Family XIII bacterium]|nr:2Fe-2S iron-sulfur cluster binding domain-containing protein [Clostridiales Family XIII bacterium]